MIRPARAADEPALTEIDRLTWSTVMTPMPHDPKRTFFDERTQPKDVLVAEVDGEIAGYVKLGPSSPLSSTDHILMVNGFSVLPDLRRRGIGRELIAAAVEEARARGARRLRLRVLGHNDGARALYEQAGFVVEGVLRDEFFLDGDYRDDVFMALDLTAPVS